MGTKKLKNRVTADTGSNPAITKSTSLEGTSSLDIYKHNSNELENSGDVPILVQSVPECKAANYVLSGARGEDGLHDHYKTFCKSYDCSFCGPRKLFLMKKGFELAIQKFSLSTFVTLTLDPKTCPVSAEGSAKYIRKLWNKFRVLQKREFNRTMQFVSVVEFQKSGYAHLHILFDGYLKHSWIKRSWVVLGGGRIVDVRKADSGTGWYLAKYLGKSMNSQRGKKRRAFSTSQGISIGRLLKEERAQETVQFRFCRLSDKEARDILKPFIVQNILDSKNRVLGFKANRQLNPLNNPQRNVTLENEKSHV